MLTIAAASDHGQISQHFGHCAGYDIFRCGTASWSPPVHPQPRARRGAPAVPARSGADIVIAGGMGTQAIALCTRSA